jgi:hypothetical protein
MSGPAPPKIGPASALQEKQQWRSRLKGHPMRINFRTAADAFNNGKATVIIMMKNNPASWAKS